MPANEPSESVEKDKSSASITGSSVAPSQSSFSLSSSNSSASFHSLFHHSNHSAKAGKQESTISHVLGPAMSSIAAHNPFGIGSLTEDGRQHRQHFHHSRIPSGDLDEGKQDEANDGDDDEGEEEEEDETGTSIIKRERRRKRDLFKRSLSPFRHHHGERKRSSSSASTSRLSTRDSIDVERERGSSRVGEMTDPESDRESVKCGITPRNNAFGTTESDEEEQDSDEGGLHATAVRAKTNKEDKRIRDQKTTSDVLVDGGDAGEVIDKVGEEEEDDYIDFDEETLDNTLYNAGCIGLHDAWQKTGDSRPGSAREEDGPPKMSDGYYGPDDYDAAWAGAGPTGHDEGDEGLRAPNVVLGEEYGHSPNEFSGEGLEVLSHYDEKGRKIHPRSNYRQPPSPSGSLRPEESPYRQWKWAEKNDGDEKKEAVAKSQMLSASRPTFERNRCTITLVHGEYERWSKESKRPKRYIAASDGSEESSYAIEWTIGTVLRDGDEMLVVSVMETDTKLDSTDPHHEDKTARQEHQMIRQAMCVVLARRATAVLQRTRLGVKVSCQALHARNARHMFIDMIDFFEPTMCIVGSRGLGSLKGVLLGSFSNYCVQKSPVPVMVARRRLKLPALPRGKGDVVSNVRARHMRLDEAMIEKDANVSENDPDGTKAAEKTKDDATADETVTEGKERDREQQNEEGLDGPPRSNAEARHENEVFIKETEKKAAEIDDQEEEEQRGRKKTHADVENGQDYVEEEERGRSRSRSRA